MYMHAQSEQDVKVKAYTLYVTYIHASLTRALKSIQVLGGFKKPEVLRKPKAMRLLVSS